MGGEPLAFFFLFGGDRTSTKAVETRKSGLNHGSDLEKATSKRKSRGSSRCKYEDKEVEKSRKVCQKKEKERSGPFSHDQVINLSGVRLVIGH